MPRTQTNSRKRSAPPPIEIEETREQKFKRLTEARMKRALNSIRLVLNTFSPNYKSTPEQRMLLVGRLQNEVDKLRDKAMRPPGKHVLTFSWDEEQETAH